MISSGDTQEPVSICVSEGLVYTAIAVNKNNYAFKVTEICALRNPVDYMNIDVYLGQGIQWISFGESSTNMIHKML